MEERAAKRIREAGSFRLPLPRAEAFKLFTAEGERLWVPGWSPEILAPLPQAPGLVFLTGEGAERTIWTVLESSVDTGCLLYSRVTQGSRAGLVAVDLTETGEHTMVRVSYDLTALSPGGEEALAAYEAPRFAEMMKQWQALIAAFLAQQDSRDQLAKLIA